MAEKVIPCILIWSSGDLFYVWVDMNLAEMRWRDTDCRWEGRPVTSPITWLEPHAQKAKFCAQRRRMRYPPTHFTSVKTHKMSFSARPLIQMNLLWVWKGGLKCTLLAWKIFFAKYKYFIIYRQKTDFFRMCSGADPLHIRKKSVFWP